MFTVARIDQECSEAAVGALRSAKPDRASWPLPETSANPPSPPLTPPRARILPAKLVVPSDHTTTLPPLPLSNADALMMVAASIATDVAVAIQLPSSAACGNAGRRRIDLAAPGVAADQHLAAAGPARRIEGRVGDFDRLAGDLNLAALFAAFLPAADSVPEILTFWVGAAPLVAAVEAPSTIMPFLVPIELASITPELLITESTTVRAVAALISTRPPLARNTPSFFTSELSG